MVAPAPGLALPLGVRLGRVLGAPAPALAVLVLAAGALQTRRVCVRVRV